MITRLSFRWLNQTGAMVRNSSSFQSVNHQLNDELSQIEAAGTYKRERVILGAQSMHIKVAGAKHDSLLNFCANNYLGLSNDKSVIEAGKNALDSHGAGLSSVRFICGTQDIHRNLENKIAQFHQRDDSILYAACFDANAGLFEVLLSDKDTVISDELNHASIIDGIRLCKAERLRYKHLDLSDLETRLKESQGSRRRLIATDGVFSMDGDIAPLNGICDLADKYDALVFLDECHATGHMGATGRGTEEHCGVIGRVDIINSTLGKSLGGAMGGYTTSSQQVVDLLRQKSRPYLFSNSLAPAVVGQATRVFEMVTASAESVQNLSKKVNKFREGMRKLGFNISGDSSCPICPVMIGDARLAADFADKMLVEGIYVIGFSYPVVPVGKSRIRVQISAAHSDSDVDRAIDAFGKIGKQLGIV